MGAPIILGKNYDLWVSNSVKDYFCEIVVNVAGQNGKDISEVYDIAPGIAGTYGVSGVGIHLEEFFPYFGGEVGLIEHLEVCKNNLAAICNKPESAKLMFNVFSWVQYLLNGGKIEKNTNFYEQKPPVS